LRREKAIGNLTRAKDYLSIEQVKEKMKEAKDPRQLQRWHIVSTTLIQPRKAEEIARCVGVSKSLVHKVIARYNREGIQSIEIKTGGGRYYEYLTKEEEKQLFAPFFQRAEKGELTTTREIHLAYEKQVGHPVHKTTLYRLWSGITGERLFLDHGIQKRISPHKKH
jgi:transposase